MRNLLIVFLALAGLCAAFAQETSTRQARTPETQATSPSATPRRAAAQRRSPATPAPVAASPTPEPRKPSLLRRMFGRRLIPAPTPEKPAATPRTSRTRKPTSTPVVAKPDRTKLASPKPRPRTRRPKAPAPEVEATTDATPANPPTDSSASVTPAPTPTPRKTSKIKEKPPAVAADIPEGTDPETAEKAKYDQAKARAAEDASVQELKRKADEASNEEEGRKASRAYNKALFNKMRRLDGSLKERIDLMEAAMMKRLGEE